MSVKKLLTLLLALTTFTSAGAAPMIPASSAQIATALSCLEHCAFTPEYGERSEVLMRWKNPIVIHVGGVPTGEDLIWLDEFIQLVNEAVPHMPTVSRTARESRASITMWFGPLDELKDHITDYQPDNWGYAYYFYNGRNVITRGEVVIASDVTTQRERNHLIMEELLCLFGLTNDHDCQSDSILYQPWTDVQELNPIDWLMLQMLYDPAVSPGMGTEQAIPLLKQTY